VKQYVEECNACQRNKNHTKQPVGKLMSNSISEKPWMHISADFITKLLLAQGYDSILVVVDQLTKIVHFIPTTEKTSAKGLARLFRDNVWKLHGLSKSKLSIVFHPQINKQTERVNQELEQYLRMFINHRQEQWPEWLGIAEFMYNNKAHSSTKTSSFKANYGQDL